MRTYSKIQLQSMKSEDLKKLQNDYEGIIQKLSCFVSDKYDELLEEISNNMDKTSTEKECHETYAEWVNVLQYKAYDAIQKYLDNASVEDFNTLLSNRKTAEQNE